MLRSKLQQFVARITLPLLACLDMLITTHVNISRVITGLLVQQPCNNTVNMIEQDWQTNSIVQSCFNILYTARYGEPLVVVGVQVC